MKFVKMHGIGNDYIYINGFEENILDREDFQDIVKKICDRHFGIGADGVIVICPSENCDAKMRMFNNDGSEGKMCGNGIRCVAKYIYDNKITNSTTLKIDTLAGVKIVELDIKDEKVVGAKVDMGLASTFRENIPFTFEKNEMINEEVNFGEFSYKITCVSVGNPHCIIFVDNVDDIDIEKVGPVIEHYCKFPDKTNVEFVKTMSKTEIQMRVWERGTGETLACGTGACASVVAGVLNNKLEYNEKVKIHLRGGELFAAYYENENIKLWGNATEVFRGEIDV